MTQKKPDGTTMAPSHAGRGSVGTRVTWADGTPAGKVVMKHGNLSGLNHAQVHSKVSHWHMGSHGDARV